MADYHRFVAYIYEYVNGRKSRNAGFAKVESRNGICRMQIHIQDLMPMEGKIEILGFVRENNTLPAVLLGERTAQGSGFDSRITTPEETFGGSPYRFDQVCGIWIKSESGRNWVTIFDDEPVDIERLGKTEQASEHEAAEKPADVEKSSDLGEMGNLRQEEKKKVVIDTGNIEREIPTETAEIQNTEEVKTTEETVIKEAKITEKIEEEEAKATEEPVTEEAKTAEAAAKEEAKAAEAAAREEAKAAEAAAREETRTAQKVKIVQETAEDLRENAERASGMESSAIPQTDIVKNIETHLKNKEENKAVLETENNKNSNYQTQSGRSFEKRKAKEKNYVDCAPKTDKRWNCATARYPHFQPVSDGSIEDAIRIQPSDLRTLWQKGWKQGSNSFLMHGFYQYHYVMLGKCREGGYVLGVPGMYNEQEQYMARMFGFPDFRPENREQSGSTFGYWCRKMD